MERDAFSNRRRRPVRLTLVLIGVLLASACSSGTPSATPVPPTDAPPSPTASPAPTTSAAPSPSPAPSPTPTEAGLSVELVRADIRRAEATKADARAAADALNAFAFDLHRALAADAGNLVTSPASVGIALGMARIGARGETASEMDALLRAVGSEDHAAWLNGLDRELAKRSGRFTDEEGTRHKLVLDITNAYFAQRGFAFETPFLDALAERFGAGMYLVDFIGNTAGARDAINRWVSDRTKERIPEILQPDDVTAATRLALVNAIYLKAPWAVPFNAGATTDQRFTRSDGSRVKVPMMWSYGGIGCAVGGSWQAARLQYIGNELSMTVIIPDDLAAFEARLDARRLARIDEALRTQYAQPTVGLPRFETETRADLARVLANLGMQVPFDPARADFSGMTTEDPLHIGTVIHQANISVDEKGTEAAAATVVGMDTGGGPTETCEAVANRPFLFLLRDDTTGVILFMGRVVDPTAG